MGAYFYAIFSMIAAGVFLPTMDTKTIMVFTQSALLFIQVTFQGMYDFMYSYLYYLAVPMFHKRKGLLYTTYMEMKNYLIDFGKDACPFCDVGEVN